MTAAKGYWITALAVIVGLFQIFLAIAFTVDAEATAGDRVFGWLVLGVPGLVLLGGLWNLRSNRFSKRVSYAAIAIGLVSTLPLFWLMVPIIAAVVVYWFGLIRGGLAREAANAHNS